MGSANMHDRLFIFAPLYSWNTTHFTENDVDNFNRANAVGFKNAVCNASPCIIGCKLHFDPKLSNGYIRKSLVVRVEVYFYSIFDNTIADHFSDSTLELLCGFERCISCLLR